MKHLILLATVFVSFSSFTTAANPTINEKVLKTFNQVFKHAKNVQWHIAAQYNEAAFEADNVKTRAFIDESGNLIKTIRYYKEDKLPANIVYNVKQQYCHDIWGVTEVSTANGTTYNIVLKCKKYWYYIIANDSGDVMLDKKFKNA